MTNKKKRRARELSQKTGMSHQAAVNALNKAAVPPPKVPFDTTPLPSDPRDPVYVGPLDLMLDKLPEGAIPWYTIEEGEIAVLHNLQFEFGERHHIKPPLVTLTEEQVLAYLEAFETFGCHRALMAIRRYVEGGYECSLHGVMTRERFVAGPQTLAHYRETIIAEFKASLDECIQQEGFSFTGRRPIEFRADVTFRFAGTPDALRTHIAKPL